MKNLLLYCFLAFLLNVQVNAQGRVNPNSHIVHGYYRKDGTYVKEHHRTDPNGTNRDNYSTLGRTNPWNGKPGWVIPDNNPLPSSYVPSNSIPTYKPIYETSSRLNINTTPAPKQTSNYVDFNTTSYNVSSPSTSNYFYDFSGGHRIINYKNGRDEFDVLSLSKKITFKKGRTYFSYDVYHHEIKETANRAEGQLLLSGPYRFYDESGTIRIVENYKNGLKNGKAFRYNEKGILYDEKEYSDGQVIYQKFKDEDGTLYELFGEMDKPGGRLLLYNESGLFKKIEFKRDRRDKRYEYASGTNTIIAEYEMLNNTLDGIYRNFHSDGKTLSEVVSYKNGKRDGEYCSYSSNGNLIEKSMYKADIANGPFELYNDNRKVSFKGSTLNGKLSGEVFRFDEDGNLLVQETYTDGKRNGPFKSYQNKKLVVSGIYLDNEKQGRWNYYWFDSSRYFLVQWSSYKNGILDGPFQMISGDSILVGTYKNGLLNGGFKAYQPWSLWLNGNPPQKLTDDEVLCIGDYNNGKKSGHWKFYSRTQTLVEEGEYWNDLKHGEWRNYFEKFADMDPNGTKHTGEVYLIENYLNGMRNGRSERLAYLGKIKVPCDTTIGTVNPLDTCYVLRYKKVKEISYYKNDMLHGPIEFRSEAGAIAQKGEYRMGKKWGNWTEVYVNPEDSSQYFRYEVYYENDQFNGLFQKFDNSRNVLLEEGALLQNKKQGLWKSYFPDNKKRINNLVDFENGNRTLTKVYNYDGKLFLFSKYQEGSMVFLEQYDTVQNRVETRFERIRFKNGNYDFDLTMVKDSMIQTQIVFEVGAANAEQDPMFFYSYFMFMLQVSPNQIYSNGLYFLRDKNGIILEEGNLQNRERQGAWKLYLYDQKIIRQTNYEAGKIISEYYFKMGSAKPFSGKYTLSRSINGNYQIIKIRKGLRSGYTLTYNSQGALIKKTKYKSGKKIEGQKD